MGVERQALPEGFASKANVRRVASELNNAAYVAALKSARGIGDYRRQKEENWRKQEELLSRLEAMQRTRYYGDSGGGVEVGRQAGLFPQKRSDREVEGYVTALMKAAEDAALIAKVKQLQEMKKRKYMQSEYVNGPAFTSPGMTQANPDNVFDPRNEWWWKGE